MKEYTLTAEERVFIEQLEMQRQTALRLICAQQKLLGPVQYDDGKIICTAAGGPLVPKGT